MLPSSRYALALASNPPTTFDPGETMTIWRLECLGYPTLFDPTGEVVRLGTRKHVALLTYLAVESAPRHRRDRLAQMLWPRSSQGESRHSLATALSAIRRCLGPRAVDYSIETIGLAPGRITTDVAELLGDHPLLDPERLGIFLDAFEVPDSNDFAGWVDAERARLLVPTRRKLARTIDDAGRVGDIDRMRQLAQRLRSIDPLAEESIRAEMEIHAMTGDWIGAIQGYRHWCNQLAEELGAEPSREIAELAGRLRRRSGRPERPRRPAPMVRERPDDGCFVGREAEYQSCQDFWDDVNATKSRVTVIAGGRGIGKTTLLDQFVAATMVQGAAVARITCHEPEREVALGVIGTMVRRLISLPGSGASSPQHLAELNRLVPEVGERWPAVTKLDVDRGGPELLRLGEALHGLADSIAVDQPLVIAVDDFHLADADSLTAVHMFARLLGNARVLLVLVDGSDSANSRQPVREVIDSIRRLGASKVELAPLGVAASRTVLANRLGGVEPGPFARDAILTAARGNPLLLETLADDWLEHGADSIAMAIDAMTPRVGVDIPEALESHLGERLSGLDDESRSILDLASLLGDRLNDLSMYTMLDLSVGRVASSVRLLTGTRLLRGHEGRLGFDNGSTRAYCYADMPQPVRELLHSRIADRLLPADCSDDLPAGFELAWHLIRSDRIDEAVPHLLRGGRDAIHHGDLLKAGHALASSLPVLSGAPLRQAEFMLAEARMELGLWNDSLGQLAALGLHGDEDDRWVSHRDLLVSLNRRWGGNISPREATDELHRLLTIVESSKLDREHRAQALSSTVAMLSGSWERQQTVRLSELANRALEGASDPFERMHVLFAKAWADACLVSRAHAWVPLSEGVSLIQKTGARSVIASRIMLAAGITRCQLGDYHAAVPLITDAFEIAEHVGNRVFLSNAAAGLALASGRLGDRKAQVEWARRSIESATRNEWGVCVLSATYELGVGLALLGRNEEAEQVMAELDHRFRGDRPAWITQAWDLYRADIFHYMGMPGRALSNARKATSGTGSTLLNQTVAGPYARWITRLSTDRRHPDPTRIGDLNELFAGRDTLDLKDQAEVIASYLQANGNAPRLIKRHAAELRSILNRLPDSIERSLRKLGFAAALDTTAPRPN